MWSGSGSSSDSGSGIGFLEMVLTDSSFTGRPDLTKKSFAPANARTRSGTGNIGSSAGGYASLALTDDLGSLTGNNVMFTNVSNAVQSSSFTASSLVQ